MKNIWRKWSVYHFTPRFAQFRGKNTFWSENLCHRRKPCPYVDICKRLISVNQFQEDIIKPRTCLSGLTQDMWQETHYSAIYRFFCDENCRVLVSYIDKNMGLVCDNNVPTSQVIDLKILAFQHEGF
jgi:hypothetical protein